MIKTPMHPIIHEELTHMLAQHFGATPDQAAKLATKLITTLHAYDMDIIRERWMEMEPAAPQPVVKEDRWTTLAKAAEELVQERNGIKPWSPPELQMRAPETRS